MVAWIVYVRHGRVSVRVNRARGARSRLHQLRSQLRRTLLVQGTHSSFFMAPSAATSNSTPSNSALVTDTFIPTTSATHLQAQKFGLYCAMFPHTGVSVLKNTLCRFQAVSCPALVRSTPS